MTGRETPVSTVDSSRTNRPTTFTPQVMGSTNRPVSCSSRPNNIMAKVGEPCGALNRGVSSLQRLLSMDFILGGWQRLLTRKPLNTCAAILRGGTSPPLQLRVLDPRGLP